MLVFALMISPAFDHGCTPARAPASGLSGEPLPASFQLVSQPEEVDPAKGRKEELREIRQEAVVKDGYMPLTAALAATELAKIK